MLATNTTQRRSDAKEKRRGRTEREHRETDRGRENEFEMLQIDIQQFILLNVTSTFVAGWHTREFALHHFLKM